MKKEQIVPSENEGVIFQIAKVLQLIEKNDLEER